MEIEMGHRRPAWRAFLPRRRNFEGVCGREVMGMMGIKKWGENPPSIKENGEGPDAGVSLAPARGARRRRVTTGAYVRWRGATGQRSRSAFLIEGGL